jgi:catechol 2,3-dioxygenase-like lactoylglutathione lyase family enzyme
VQRPEATAGLRHVALFVRQFEACLRFYQDLLGMQVEWHPDTDNIYLSSGNDNLALHRAPAHFDPAEHQRLDHIGFILNEPQQVDHWYDFLTAHGVPMRTAPRTHRDGARSFYCLDPDSNVVQMIYHPPLATSKA